MNATYNIKVLKPLIIVGAGGHGVSVASVALAAGYVILGFIDREKQGQILMGIPVLGDLEDVNHRSQCVFAVAVGDNTMREHVYQEMMGRDSQLQFPVLAHPSAVMGFSSKVGDGTVLMPGAIVGPLAQVGRFCIINTRASLDHECVMGDYSSLAPGAMTGGNSKIGLRSAICIGARVDHSTTIGQDTVIGGNSYANRDIPSHCVAYGTPAKVIRSRDVGDPYLNKSTHTERLYAQEAKVSKAA